MNTGRQKRQLCGEPLRLGVLCGAMYFIQGLAEPTEGLIAQPVRSLQRSWGQSAAEISGFAAAVAIPWSLKPLYGILTDFFPLFGSRRRNYMLVVSGAAFLGLGYLYWFPPAPGASRRLLWSLLIPTVGVAFADVVVDAIMIERGQPLGLTGRLQSIQWAANYTATIIAGSLGGYLSQHHRQDLGFLICAGAALGTLVLTIAFVREERPATPTSDCLDAKTNRMRTALRLVWDTATTPAILAAGGFLFLFNFNPFSQTVLHLHMTRELGHSEQFCGHMVAVLSVAAIVASLAYGAYCRHVRFEWLIHVSIVAGIASNLAYWGLAGPTSAVLVTAAVGFTYMTANLVLMDLAARVCDPATAGTTFAILMALSNLSMSLSGSLGGNWYDWLASNWGSAMAFQLLVGIGAAFTAGCWLLVPVLRKFDAGR